MSVPEAELPDRPVVVVPTLGRPSSIASQVGNLAPSGGAADLRWGTERVQTRVMPQRARPTPSPATPAIRADGGDAERWALRAASIAGPAHRSGGRSNQDAYGWAHHSPDWLVVAAADGVSAAAYGGLGSEVAVKAAIGAAVASLGEGADDAGAAARDAAMEAAADAVGNVPGVAASELATTLVVAVAGEDRWWLARVGDSSAWVFGNGRAAEVFVPAEGGDDLVPTVTAALPSPEVERAEVMVEANHALVLVTDGIGNPLRDGPTTVLPAFVDGLAAPPEPIALAALVSFSRHGCTDDRTLLGVWRRET